MVDGYRITTSVLVGGQTAPRFVDVGTIIHVAAVFADSAGTAANPANVYFSYRASAVAATTTYTYSVSSALVRSSTGNYYVDLDTRESAGLWEWRFLATGVGGVSDHDTFYVRPSNAV